MSQRVLILCTGNSCRSQIAEGLWNRLGGGAWQAVSAGSRPAGYVHPLAVEVMREAGVDLSDARSKHVGEFAEQPLDLVVTVCDSAREACPVFSGAKQTLHWPFEDPAEVVGSEQEKRDAFRKVRDEIRQQITRYLTEQR